jgi:hypothetical protein
MRLTFYFPLSLIIKKNWKAIEQTFSEANSFGSTKNWHVGTYFRNDMPQMERAQLQVAAHDPSFYSGYAYGRPLDPYVVLSPTRGAEGTDGFWVQPFGNGCL